MVFETIRNPNGYEFKKITTGGAVVSLDELSSEVGNNANGKISLSKMTFSHQMICLFMIEQLYRAFTILRNEPYHHR